MAMHVEPSYSATPIYEQDGVARRLVSISAMPDCSGSSHEELRLAAGSGLSSRYSTTLRRSIGRVILDRPKWWRQRLLSLEIWSLWIDEIVESVLLAAFRDAVCQVMHELVASQEKRLNEASTTPSKGKGDAYAVVASIILQQEPVPKIPRTKRMSNRGWKLLREEYIESVAWRCVRCITNQRKRPDSLGAAPFGSVASGETWSSALVRELKHLEFVADNRLLAMLQSCSQGHWINTSVACGPISNTYIADELDADPVERYLAKASQISSNLGEDDPMRELISSLRRLNIANEVNLPPELIFACDIDRNGQTRVRGNPELHLALMLVVKQCVPLFAATLASNAVSFQQRRRPTTLLGGTIRVAVKVRTVDFRPRASSVMSRTYSEDSLPPNASAARVVVFVTRENVTAPRLRLRSSRAEASAITVDCVPSDEFVTGRSRRAVVFPPDQEFRLEDMSLEDPMQAGRVSIVVLDLIELPPPLEPVREENITDDGVSPEERRFEYYQRPRPELSVNAPVSTNVSPSGVELQEREKLLPPGSESTNKGRAKREELFQCSRENQADSTSCLYILSDQRW